LKIRVLNGDKFQEERVDILFKSLYQCRAVHDIKEFLSKWKDDRTVCKLFCSESDNAGRAAIDIEYLCDNNCNIIQVKIPLETLRISSALRGGSLKIETNNIVGATMMELKIGTQNFLTTATVLNVMNKVKHNYNTVSVCEDNIIVIHLDNSKSLKDVMSIFTALYSS